MRRILYAALAGALLVAGTTSADARPSGGVGQLGTYGAYGARVATDGQGAALAVWTELDQAYTSGDYSQKFRVSVSDRLPGSAQWSAHTVVSGFGAVASPTFATYGSRPQVSAALVPGGSAVVAWVQNVAGEPRVQVSGRSGLQGAWSTPATLPRADQCGALSGYLSLELEVGGGSGYLNYQTLCSSGFRYQDFVPVSASGAVGAPYSAGPAGSQLTSLVRVAGEVDAVYVDPYSGFLDAYPVGATALGTPRVLDRHTYPVASAANGDPQALAVAAPGGRIVSAFRGSDAGTVKLGVDVDSGLENGDLTWFDPVAGSQPSYPSVSASPNGTLTVAWLEDGQAWAAFRRPGGSWSTPARSRRRCGWSRPTTRSTCGGTPRPAGRAARSRCGRRWPT